MTTIAVPDWLALFRVGMVLPIMAFTRADQIDNHLYFAAALFSVAALTDFLDGWIARRTTGGTVLGGFLDTTADKILVAGTLFALVSVDRVSIWPAALIIFREFTVMALRGVVAQRGGLIGPSTWGKLKTLTQFLAIFFAYLRLSEPWGPWYFDQWVMLIAVIATIGSMWGYLSAFWHVIRSESAEVRS